MTFSSEKHLQDEAIRYLKSLDDCWFIKTVGGATQSGGAPDLIVCYRGRFYGFELKLGGDYKLTGRQRLTLKRIREAGGVGMEITSVEQMIEVLKYPL